MHHVNYSKYPNRLREHKKKHDTVYIDYWKREQQQQQKVGEKNKEQITRKTFVRVFFLLSRLETRSVVHAEDALHQVAQGMVSQVAAHVTDPVGTEADTRHRERGGERHRKTTLACAATACRGRRTLFGLSSETFVL